MFLVDMGTLSCRVSMWCPSAHMKEKDHKCVYTQKVAETKAVSRYLVPCLKTAPTQKITNEAVLSGLMP